MDPGRGPIRASNVDRARSSTKTDAVYFELRDRILAGELAGGTRLDQEVLAESLGVSTTPLREALRRLEADRLVVRTAYRDVTIAPMTVTEARQLFAVRMDLDILAIGLAARYMTDDELSLAERMMDASAESCSQYLNEQGIIHQPSMARARAFHHVLYCGSHNDVLIETLDGLWARTERYAFLATGTASGRSDGSRKNQTEHQAMLEAIHHGDAEAARSVMSGHDSAMRAVEQFLLEPLPHRRRWPGDEITSAR